MQYSEYLKSKEWKTKRAKVLKRADYRCMLCYSDGSLDVHHRTYKRIFHELLSDLIALCENCHEKFHGILPEYRKPYLVKLEVKQNGYNKEFEKINKELMTCSDENRIKELLRLNLMLCRQASTTQKPNIRSI